MSTLEGARVSLLACGSYNPPTIMHLRMFESARSFLECRCGCEVVEGILSPVADYFGKPDLLPAAHRLKMSDLAVKTSSWIRVDPWECTQSHWTRTLSVLKHFKQVLNCNFNGKRLMLLCGGDVVDSFKQIKPSGDYLWEPSDVAAIIRDFGLVVLARENTNPLNTLSQLGYNGHCLKNVVVFEDPVMPNNISSTRLRAAIRRGESIKYCTTDAVIEYIAKHELYLPRNNRTSSFP
ncbi:unnamed protein product [Thelazia callipaeda]|uniref:Nicotinamide-nucleotide adenylyltransferase n=1 Tax=Thelazia callipaeda TaxID=103827 RepID=A0A0N5D4V0_THECL|nr:unnamed protein product [Thelazia callipaeda]